MLDAATSHMLHPPNPNNLAMQLEFIDAIGFKI